MPNPASTNRAARDARSAMRLNRDRIALIDRAAEAVGKTRSAFILDAACREAETVLPDRLLLAGDEATFAAFTAALDAAPGDNPRLRRLLARKARRDA
jgi:uncharacterized protein (DUF1778 family)